jgi:hypothetical protein
MTLQDNPWGWDGHANVIYVDQPIGTGFSWSDVRLRLWAWWCEQGTVGDTCRGSGSAARAARRLNGGG